jgi:hypothetical protein
MSHPKWIDQDHHENFDEVTFLNDLQRGGCESGMYMPAVVYHQASATMAKHGDDVLAYIEEALGEVPKPPADSSWSGIAVHYLSTAVELYASQRLAELEEAESDRRRGW